MIKQMLMVGVGAMFACAAVSRAGPIISELMAANTKVHADRDGAFSDWIELHNPDDTAVDLEGWYLTDSASNKRKWKLPAVTLPPGGYLIIFASNKDRINPAAPLHTNFALSAGGELRYHAADAELDETLFARPRIDLGGWTYNFTLGVRF